MPQVIETTVYTFDELGDKAKEKARAWWRDGGLDYPWWDGTLEDAYSIAEQLGLDVRPVNSSDRERSVHFSGFGSQGDGAHFTGYYVGSNGEAVAKLKAYAPKDEKLHSIAADFDALWELAGYAFTCRITHYGHYSHELSMFFDTDYTTDDEKGGISEQTAERAEELLKRASRRFARWIYRQLEDEYTYLLSDESVDENIRANEYTFTAEGRRFG